MKNLWLEGENFDVSPQRKCIEINTDISGKTENTCMSLGLNSLFHINGIHGPHMII